MVNEIVFDQGYKNVAEYLKKVDSEYEGVIQYRDPEEILFEWFWFKNLGDLYRVIA